MKVFRVSLMVLVALALLATVCANAQPQSTRAPQAGETAPPKEVCWYDKICINGYFHNRYEARQDSEDDFLMRRLYVNLIGSLNDRTTAVVTFGRVGPEDPKIDLACAFVDYKATSEWSLRVGQAPTAFGYDAAESSSKRLPLERFVGVEGIPTRTDRPGLPGLYFKGPWDRGVWLTRKPTGSEPSIMVGLTNGNFREADNNSDKTYTVDLKWKRPWGTFGASWLDGRLIPAPGAPESDRRGLDLFVHTDPAPWGFQAEYIDGDLLGTSMDGWYGQVAFNRGRVAQPIRVRKARLLP